MSVEAQTTALAEAARTAGYAPSIHNTQPWRWRVGPTSLQLWAERDRQLAITDPAGRMLTVSCGAALLRQRMLDARLDARRYTREHGEDDPEISGWTWDFHYQQAGR